MEIAMRPKSRWLIWRKSLNEDWSYKKFDLIFNRCVNLPMVNTSFLNWRNIWQKMVLNLVQCHRHPLEIAMVSLIMRIEEEERKTMNEQFDLSIWKVFCPVVCSFLYHLIFIDISVSAYTFCFLLRFHQAMDFSLAFCSLYVSVSVRCDRFSVGVFFFIQERTIQTDHSVQFCVIEYLAVIDIL